MVRVESPLSDTPPLGQWPAMFGWISERMVAPGDQGAALLAAEKFITMEVTNSMGGPSPRPS